VSLRILFADDSMTAQNMGKKILSEAGYDVIAVSNGAAAVKKIAEQKPDIIILDVYMPGYSGLEVCEKVRASLDTVKIPVLLTVGKMEPYKPEDANRVKADGVIIKPFEATDLLAIVKKFEERIAAMPPPPIVAQTVRIEPKYQEEVIEGPEHVDHHTSSGKSHTQPMVEVPDHMASSSAFSDLLGTDAPNTTQHFAVNTPSTAFETSVIVPVPPVVSSEDETPTSWKEGQAEHITTVAVESEPDIVATRVSDDQEAVQEAPVESRGFGGIDLPEPETQAMEAQPETAEPDTQVIPVEASEAPRHPQFIPVYKEPEPDLAAYEMMPTAAAPTGEIEIPRDPELQESAEETTRNTVADHVEPGLLSPREQLETPIVPESEPVVAETHVEAAPLDAAPFEVAPIEVAPAVMEVTPVEAALEEVKPLEVVPVESDFAPAPPIELPTVEAPVAEVAAVAEAAPPAEVTPQAAAPAAAAPETVSDSDFEARVAAAMAAYNHAEATPSPAEASSVTPAAVAESPVTAVAEAAPANNAYKAQAFEIAQPAEPAPSFEYHPAAKAPEPTPVAHTPAPAEIASEPDAAPPAFVAPPSAAPAPVPVEAAPSLIHNAIASVEAAAVAAVTDMGSDHHNITQAIHRVMERLKPELVEEIMRELKPKK
jgi:CheY-like chemotaxis protein